MPQSPGGTLLPPAISSQPVLVCLWMGRPTHQEKDTSDLDVTATGFKNSPTCLVPGYTPCCLSWKNFQPYPTPVCGWPVASQSNQGDCWRGTKALLAQLFNTEYKPAWKKAQICRQEVVPWVCHLKRASGAWTWEEASHLFSISAEQQERSLWVHQGCHTLSDLDTGFLWNW